MDEIRILLTAKQLNQIRTMQQNIAMATALRDSAFHLLLSSAGDEDLTNWSIELTDKELIARPPRV